MRHIYHKTRLTRRLARIDTARQLNATPYKYWINSRRAPGRIYHSNYEYTIYEGNERSNFNVAGVQSRPAPVNRLRRIYEYVTRRSFRDKWSARELVTTSVYSHARPPTSAFNHPTPSSPCHHIPSHPIPSHRRQSPPKSRSYRVIIEFRRGGGAGIKLSTIIRVTRYNVLI